MTETPWLKNSRTLSTISLLPSPLARPPNLPRRKLSVPLRKRNRKWWEISERSWAQGSRRELVCICSPKKNKRKMLNWEPSWLLVKNNSMNWERKFNPWKVFLKSAWVTLTIYARRTKIWEIKLCAMKPRKVSLRREWLSYRLNQNNGNHSNRKN